MGQALKPLASLSPPKRDVCGRGTRDVLRLADARFQEVAFDNLNLKACILVSTPAVLW